MEASLGALQRARSGLFADVQEHLAAANGDGIAGNTLGMAEPPPRSEVEASLVERAGHAPVAHDPVRERPARMRADGVDRVPAGGGAGDGDPPGAEGQGPAVPGRDG